MEIVEIGPGLGSLSYKLIQHFDVRAYEIDRDLCNYLENKFSNKRFNLINMDVLNLEFNNGWLHNNPYILVSNLPYYLATKIILNLFRDNMCKGMLVMTQKEVALKFCAKEESRDFCVLSVLSRSISDKINILMDIPSSAFSPSPKVESTIFSICKNSKTIENGFESFLKKAFSSPRKNILNNLNKINGIKEILSNLNINTNLRPHQISTIQYHQIFNKIKEINYGRK